MNPLRESQLIETRRHFFGRTSTGIGTAALGSLLNPSLFGAEDPVEQVKKIAPKAKRVIYLFMSGAPSQLDMWDYKPGLKDWYDKDLPDSIRNGQRITTMTSGQSRFPIAPSKFKFNQHGKEGTWVSELLPHTAGIVDDIAVLKAVNTRRSITILPLPIFKRVANYRADQARGLGFLMDSVVTIKTYQLL